MRRIALALSAAVLVAGCGNDDGTSKEDFVRQAGAICTRNKDRAERLFNREFGEIGVRPPTERESRQVLRAMLPLIRATGDAIARLDPPKGDEQRVAAYLRAYGAAIDEMSAITRNGHRARLLMTGRLKDPFAKADHMAGEYGIEKCSGDDA